ncbi:replication initiation protein [Streptomyces sp. NBC_00191]|uniref:replication initiator protein RepSA n=1 Tax=Streptomyces sp. NBC_00191 TaxID=2975674 RepID=UPI00324E032E
MADTLDPTTLGDLLRVASAPDFARWQDQIKKTGGCAQPVHLTGWSLTRDKSTGQVLHTYSTQDEPGGRLRIACGNRRASRCQPCAYLYAGDAYRLVRAGLSGDDAMNIPAAVRERPRVFATLTAPSFGRVHNIPDTGSRCRCGTRHTVDDPALGTALDPETYDYTGAVLFNNHAGELWHRFINRLRRELAASAGLTQKAFKESARLSFNKVAEFQKRGAIHFHAVIRIDGPDGPDSPPPEWATLDLLTQAIREAREHSYTAVTVPAVENEPARTLCWGEKLDVRPIQAFDDGDDISEQKVAAYVAKYATKAAETTGALDRRVGELAELDQHRVPEHARRLIRACWDLDPLYPDRKLWAWAHMLGFRGHFLTKSRRYSSTFTERRQVRADYRAAEQRQALGLPEPDTTLVLADWQYAGHGHTPGESALAASIAEDIRINRETAREAMQDQRTNEGEY